MNKGLAAAAAILAVAAAAAIVVAFVLYRRERRRAVYSDKVEFASNPIYGTGDKDVRKKVTSYLHAHPHPL